MNVQAHLDQSRVAYEVLRHEPTYDAQHMAQAVHVKGAEVAKTVLLRANHGYRYLTAIVPASRQIDFALASQALGDSELRLAEEREVNEVCLHCEPGVLPPFGSQYGVKTVVDASLAEHDEIYFEGNTHAETIRMSFADFIRLETPLIAPLTRSP